MIHGALPLPYFRDGGEVVVGGGEDTAVVVVVGTKLQNIKQECSGKKLHEGTDTTSGKREPRSCVRTFKFLNIIEASMLIMFPCMVYWLFDFSKSLQTFEKLFVTT